MAREPAEPAVVAFREPNLAATATDVYVQKLVGPSWVTIGDPINPVAGQSPNQTNLTLDAHDRPIVALTAASECYVLRANKL